MLLCETLQLPISFIDKEMARDDFNIFYLLGHNATLSGPLLYTFTIPTFIY